MYTFLKSFFFDTSTQIFRYLFSHQHQALLKSIYVEWSKLAQHVLHSRANLNSTAN